MRKVFVVAVLIASSACVSSGDRPRETEASPREAAQINYQLGSQYFRQGKLKLARERLERAIEQDPSLPGPYTALALIYDQTGDFDRADSYYRDALRVAPRDANVQNTYGFFLCNRGRHAEGQKYFARAAANPDNRAPEVAFSNAGVCALAMPDRPAAENYFREALKRDPDFPDALLQMAALSHASGNAMSARAFFQRYTATTELNAATLLLGVRIEKSLDDRDAMLQYAKELRRRFPDSAEASKLMDVINDG